MNNIFAARKYFVRQHHANDCGPACLNMIFNYTGRFDDGRSIRNGLKIPEAGLSLLDLREIAASRGLRANCVRMDTVLLRTAAQPCILYFRGDTDQPHFVVCFGVRRRKDTVSYLIGDPALHVHLISEEALLLKWRGAAALYFENISRRKPALREHAFISLMNIAALRKSLLLIVPSLNICSAVLALILSWTLQRGISDSAPDKSTGVLTAIGLLLLLIMLSKALISLVRQHVLINLNTAISRQFNTAFIRKHCPSDQGNTQFSENSIRKGLSDIMKIQNAVTALVFVLFSDGSVVFLLIAGLLYHDTLTGLVSITYAAVMILLHFRRTPVSAYHSSRVGELSGTFENGLMTALLKPGSSETGEHPDDHIDRHSRYLSASASFARRVIRSEFLYECIGTINIAAVLACSMVRVRSMELSYGGLTGSVLLSFYITILMPRISSALRMITEGAELTAFYLC